MNIRWLTVGAFEENCALLWKDPAQALVVDPGDEADHILETARSLGIRLAGALLTHGHIDHIAALDGLLAATPELPVYLHPADAEWAFTPVNRIPPYLRVPGVPAGLRAANDGDALSVGGLEIAVLHTPGHSPGSVCYYLGGEKVLLAGDTLFAGSVGRTDLPGGDMRRQQDSLARLMTLPGEVVVCPGHGPRTTIARERAFNPFLA
ncbi:MAG: MBL fold metallo-hydrolase [Kiritimatiellia bacterium]|jgi:hydroxyacylglutathione hydrolase